MSLIIFSISLYIEFIQYKNLTNKKTKFLNNVFVESQYYKKDKIIFKLRHKNILFYSSSKENLKNLKHRFIDILILTNRITFLDYLKGFYATGLYISLNKENTLYQKNLKYIKNQHDSNKITNLFQAIFLASSISPKDRRVFTLYGISHLIAISGFHIAILLSILLFILNPIYKFFQQKYFPYRNRWLDLSIISLLILVGYLYFIGSPPSLLRSLFMYFLAIIFLFSYIKILSFNVLFITATILIALNPRLAFSLGFFLSLSGVFYIYLFLKWAKNIPIIAQALLLNIFLFLMMLPIVHYFFNIFSIYQILSIPMSILFTIFYPLYLFLHLINYGAIFDNYLLILINAKMEFITIQTPLWLYITYILSSLLSIKYTFFFYLSVVISLVFFIFMLYSYIGTIVN